MMPPMSANPIDLDRPPLICVSPNCWAAEPRRLYQNKPLEYGEAGMAEAIFAAGGLPIMAYKGHAESAADLDARASAVIARCDGLLLSGGADIDPGHYGETPEDPAWAGDLGRDYFEFALLRHARHRRLPVLGVCRGAQLINVALGGSMWQDLPSMRPKSLPHRDQDTYCQLAHPISITPGTRIAGIMGGDDVVNSVHHQAIRELAPGMVATAHAPDGVIEAFEPPDPDAPWLLAVQWHPEWRQEAASHRRVFEVFVRACAQAHP